MGAVGGRNFGFPIDLAHRLYNSLLLPHKPWLNQSVVSMKWPGMTVYTAADSRGGAPHIEFRSVTVYLYVRSLLLKRVVAPCKHLRFSELRRRTVPHRVMGQQPRNFVYQDPVFFVCIKFWQIFGRGLWPLIGTYLFPYSKLLDPPMTVKLSRLRYRRKWTELKLSINDTSSFNFIAQT